MKMNKIDEMMDDKKYLRQKLRDKIKTIKPKIHVCGHIHSGRGIVLNDGTLYINASVLDERYHYTQTPFTIDFDFKTNDWEVIEH